MIRTILLLLILLTGARAPLLAQGRQGSTSQDEGPIATLLEARIELGLTASQVERLEEIDAAMDQRNQPLVTRLVEVRGRIRALGRRDQFTDDQRALYESYLAEARPLVRQIERNNRAAMRQVGDLLSESQKARMSTLLEQRGENRDRNGRR